MIYHGNLLVDPATPTPISLMGTQERVGGVSELLTASRSLEVLSRWITHLTSERCERYRGVSASSEQKLQGTLIRDEWQKSLHMGRRTLELGSRTHERQHKDCRHSLHFHVFTGADLMTWNMRLRDQPVAWPPSEPTMRGCETRMSLCASMDLVAGRVCMRKDVITDHDCLDIAEQDMVIKIIIVTITINGWNGPRLK